MLSGPYPIPVLAEVPCLNRRGLSYWPSDSAHYAQSKYEKLFSTTHELDWEAVAVSALRV